eukprot:snap_masked-scaffold_2-processed-gene-4.17-mRNA-1 protein AED:1.00 eAED:1.00 QI:0/0/0/0/1/1/3/0/77
MVLVKLEPPQDYRQKYLNLLFLCTIFLLSYPSLDPMSSKILRSSLLLWETKFPINKDGKVLTIVTRYLKTVRQVGTG